VVVETDLALGDGRTLHVYDTGSGDGTAGLAVFWQHGASSTGAPPEPLFAAAADWFAGMTPSGAAEYRAAATGRAALEAYFASAEFDPEVFTPADHAALFGTWSWMGTVAGQALATDQGGMVDDDLAYVTPSQQQRTHAPGTGDQPVLSRLTLQLCGLIHTDTCTGSSARDTTAARSSRAESGSTASCRRAANSATIWSAS